MRPRALSSTPTVRASCRSSPPSRAASVPLPILVTTASTVTASSTAQPVPSMLFSATDWPETTKKNGSSSELTSCNGRSRSGSSVPPSSRGTTTPASSAPKITCSPRECVTHADPRAKPMSSASRREGSSRVRHSRRRSNGRAASTITVTKPTASTTRHGQSRAAPSPPPSIRAPASTVQQTASSTPAADTATTPGTDRDSSFSRTMAVSTGTAVIDRAIPANTTMAGDGSRGMPSSCSCSRKSSAPPQPTAIGTTNEARATVSEVRARSPRIFRSSS